VIDIVATFITFFAVVDPFGTVPVFVAATNHFDDSARRRIALIATLAAAGILLFFLVAGELILTAMSIPLSAFQVAGGIVLFIFALTMIFGESKPEEEVRLADDHRVYPDVAGGTDQQADRQQWRKCRKPGDGTDPRIRGNNQPAGRTQVVFRTWLG